VATAQPSDTPAPTGTPTPAATETPAIVLTRLGDITAARVGEEVTVEAKVVGTASFQEGFKFTLDDGTGQIVLLMWHNVYDDCWDAAKLNLGALVRATGEIGEYEGEMQIEPGFGGDVKAVEAAGPWATAREIGSLSGDDADQRVMIEGDVVRVEGGNGWTKVFVGDETGEVVVFLWSNVLDRIPSNTKLGEAGTHVRIVGTLEVYQNNLQVVPALPYDVVVED
jgi:RecJ-like exonuclease